MSKTADKDTSTSSIEYTDVKRSAYPGGIIDLHLCQQFSINAEVAEVASLIVDDAVALAGYWDEPWALTVVRPLQSPQ